MCSALVLKSECCIISCTFFFGMLQSRYIVQITLCLLRQIPILLQPHSKTYEQSCSRIFKAYPQKSKGWSSPFASTPQVENSLNNNARTYLQPHYGNGVFGNVYLSAGQHSLRGKHCRHPIAGLSERFQPQQSIWFSLHLILSLYFFQKCRKNYKRWSDLVLRKIWLDIIL